MTIEDVFTGGAYSANKRAEEAAAKERRETQLMEKRTAGIEQDNNLLQEYLMAKQRESMQSNQALSSAMAELNDPQLDRMFADAQAQMDHLHKQSADGLRRDERKIRDDADQALEKTIDDAERILEDYKRDDFVSEAMFKSKPGAEEIVTELRHLVGLAREQLATREKSQASDDARTQLTQYGVTPVARSDKPDTSSQELLQTLEKIQSLIDKHEQLKPPASPSDDLLPGNREHRRSHDQLANKLLYEDLRATMTTAIDALARSDAAHRETIASEPPRTTAKPDNSAPASSLVEQLQRAEERLSDLGFMPAEEGAAGGTSEQARPRSASPSAPEADLATQLAAARQRLVELGYDVAVPPARTAEDNAGRWPDRVMARAAAGLDF